MKTSSTVGHFDLDGSPLTFAEWAAKMETKNYRRIALSDAAEAGHVAIVEREAEA